MINYDFPLNEKLRRFLRIEELFEKMDVHLKSRNKFSDYMTFEILFNLMSSASRSDLKVELMQELEKQNIKVKQRRKSANSKTLQNKILRIKKILSKNVLQPGFYFGDDRLIQEIKTRRDSPFGILSTDFPEFKFWLESKNELKRKIYFQKKIEPFIAIKDATKLILNLLRKESVVQAAQTSDGHFQIKLNPLEKKDIVIVTLQKKLRVIPNISSNKYAINIQFTDSNHKKINQKINFKIALSKF